MGLKTCLALTPLLLCCASESQGGALQEPGEAQAPVIIGEGFDDQGQGELPKGWTAPAGHAELHGDNQHRGTHSLRLLGGSERTVTWRPSLPEDFVGSLSFWAERWTRRAPFQASLERLDGERWSEIWRGDKEVAIGGFHTQVRVPLGAPAPAALRWTSSSPEGSGLLIDSVSLKSAGPMRILKSWSEAPILPCLVELENNPLCAWVLETSGDLEAKVVQELRVSLGGTSDLADLVELRVWASKGPADWTNGDPDRIFREAQPFGAAQVPARELVFRGRHELGEGVTRFWLAARLRPGADLDGHIVVRPLGIEVEGEASIELEGGPVRQRLGRALRTAGDGGSAAYRIPGLATTNKGTLIAVYDIRWGGWGDLPGNMDVGMSRSVDGGRTWKPMEVIMDMGSDPQHSFDGVGDPAVLVDRVNGRIWVIATWSHGERAWRGSGPGLTPEETGQLMVVTSDDDGVTWSKPRNLTSEVKDPEWCYLLQGPGRGITTSDGTLVFAAQYQDAQRLPHSTLLTSRDRGETWEVLPGPKGDTTEAQVVELGGQLMLNMRDNRGGSRSVYTTADLGRTWAEHPSSRSALVEPVCMASLLHVERELGLDRDGVLLFSNPAVPKAPRRRMTLKASKDGGLTWPAEHHILMDEGQSAGYSCLTLIDKDTVGILFEGSRAHMTFMRVPLAELTGP